MPDNTMIIVAGAARSYTSVIAGILYHAGAWGGKSKESLGIDFYMSQKVYENIDMIGDFMYEAAKIKSLDIYAPEEFSSSLQCVAPNVLAFHGAPDEGTVFVKHPAIISYRGASEWDTWDAAFPDAKWVIVRRPTEDILKSHFSMWGQVRHDTRNVLLQLDIMKSYFKGKNKDYFEIWPGKAMQDADNTEFKSLVDWAGLNWNKAIEKHIQPNYKQNNTMQNYPFISKITLD